MQGIIPKKKIFLGKIIELVCQKGNKLVQFHQTFRWWSCERAKRICKKIAKNAYPFAGKRSKNSVFFQKIDWGLLETKVTGEKYEEYLWGICTYEEFFMNFSAKIHKDVNFF